MSLGFVPLPGWLPQFMEKGGVPPEVVSVAVPFGAAQPEAVVTAPTDGGIGAKTEAEAVAVQPLASVTVAV